MDGVSHLDGITHASEYGTWTLFRRPPPPMLARYVREIQGYYEAGGVPVIRKELPSTQVPLILVLGPGFTLHGLGASQVRPLARSFVAGLHEVPAMVGSEGRAICMQVDFTPVGARRFFGLDMHEIAGQVIDLNAILGHAADRLEERLAATNDWRARFDLVEDILHRRTLDGRPEAPLVGAAMSAIERTGGDIEVGWLARELGCSRKHLVSLFRRDIGLAPKSVARVCRFDRAVVALQSGAVRSLAELAAACGYADQAHFNREFRAFAGESPTAIIARMLPDGTGIMARPPVTNVQA